MDANASRSLLTETDEQRSGQLSIFSCGGMRPDYDPAYLSWSRRMLSIRDGRR